MSETTEEQADDGTWYCSACKTPITVTLVQTKPNHFKIISSCPKKHNITFVLVDENLEYLNKTELRKLARVYMLFQLDDLDKVNKDIYKDTLIKSMSSISGLSWDDCEKIIIAGLRDGTVKQTQKPVKIEEKISKGKSVFIQEVTIDDDS